MDRFAHPRHYSDFVSTMPPVDAYMDGGAKQDPTWNLLDTSYSTYLYDRFGNVGYTTPLENWPQFPYSTPRTEYPTMHYYNNSQLEAAKFSNAYGTKRPTGVRSQNQNILY